MRKLYFTVAMMAASLFPQFAEAQMTDLDLQAGDTVEIDGKKWMLGPNIVINPSFDEVTEDGVISGWVNGLQTEMTTTDFYWYESGGFDDGAYIKSKTGGGSGTIGSILMQWQLQSYSKYYMTFWMKARKGINEQYIPEMQLVSPETTTSIIGPTSSVSGPANRVDENTWTRTSFFFESENYQTLKMNGRWFDKTCFDGFYLAKLYDLDLVTPEDIQKLRVETALYTLRSYTEISLVDYPGLQEEANDVLMEYENFVPADEAEANAAIEKINETLETVRLGKSSASDLTDLMVEAEKYINSPEPYPGIDALAEIYGNIIIDAYTWRSDDYINACESLEKGINDYLFSQVPTPEKPADYTFLVQNPLFCKPGTEPTIVDGVFTYPNGDSYKEGSAPADATSAGWYKGANGGGDQRLNYAGERICWNAWNTSFDEISINQDLTGIPNGYYTVVADLRTQPGCVIDQRTYAKSTLSSGESTYLQNADVWETLTTSKVMVSDGKMTIGAVGSGDKVGTPAEYGGTHADHRRGWFLVTNFKLYYHGTLSEEDLKTAFDSKIVEMQAQCDTMIFKGDKAVYQDSINKYKGVTGIENINEALVSLTAAQSEANKSVAKQVSVQNGITKALTDSIESGAYTGDYATMAGTFCNCMNAEINAADATYTEMDSIVQILYSFRDVYVPTLVKARALEVNDSEAKAVLDKNINDQVADFTSMEALPLQTKVEKYAADLETAIAECEAFNLYQTGTKDYTCMIANPGINSTTGWSFISNVSGVSTTSAQVDGDKSGRYLDGYHWEAGGLLYTAYQTINYIPNGKYRVKAMTRLNAPQGAYMYAIADGDSATTVLSQIEQEYMNITKFTGELASDGKDSIALVSNTYGSIFEDLYDRTNNGGDATPEQSDTLNANNGKGFGWHYTSVDIEVKNHTLTFGVTCDSTFTMKYGGKPWTGNWFSADNFTLTLLEEGNNDGWNPTTGITTPEEAEEQIVVRVENGTIVANGDIYSLSGMRVASGSKVPAGVYIVKLGKQSMKVLVK